MMRKKLCKPAPDLITKYLSDDPIWRKPGSIACAGQWRSRRCWLHPELIPDAISPQA